MRPWSTRSWATCQGLDQRSYIEKESPNTNQRASSAKTTCSLKVQTEIRNVLDRMTTGAARRIINSSSGAKVGVSRRLCLLQ